MLSIKLYLIDKPYITIVGAKKLNNGIFLTIPKTKTTISKIFQIELLTLIFILKIYFVIKYIKPIGIKKVIIKLYFNAW